jgi:hypothetical protein
MTMRANKTALLEKPKTNKAGLRDAPRTKAEAEAQIKDFITRRKRSLDALAKL